VGPPRRLRESATVTAVRRVGPEQYCSALRTCSFTEVEGRRATDETCHSCGRRDGESVQVPVHVHTPFDS
jgi:hypothetical protein